MKTYGSHPYADLFPMMSTAERESLTEDIAANGLRQPIIRYQGVILDGRNRLLACQDAGIEPTFTEHEGDDASALALVISLNSQRRDLTAGQRAIVAAKRWMLYGKTKHGGSRTKDQSDSVSRNHLAKQFRTSVNSISQARDILAEAPDLVMLVETCVRSLAFATEELEGRRAQARKQSQDAEKASRFSAEYREALSDGRTTPEEAMEEIFRREREERERLRVETEARQIWFEQLAGVIEWSKKWVSGCTDERLAWYTAEDAPSTGYHIACDEIDGVISQLKRIKAFTLSGGSNGRQKGSQKASAAQA